MTTFRHDTEFFSLSLRTEHDVACLRLTGEIDEDCAAVLTDTAADLHRLAPPRLFVDLAEVSFAGATFVNFLVRLVHGVPRDCVTLLCRATPQTVRLLCLTSTDSIAARSDRLPDAWLDPHERVLDPVPT
ncbi:hypothetical protein Ais01nite_11370 [Asanoa ishikariensis]|uniref:Anti-anti-sigma factor n=1 Tax=Asanoa ishikariensis TaxID=137265 RepID=A0A1H3T285_9ACTN|nr:STAS domain-containing protein [Asanoa ishikariensis]GIF63102.1 hypothetical protein Ais01nite_11370 [Asanoa ishikariensis]SDZ44294.1 hypothetical protein SAMN05421684_5091 [Asanoa ishikariensis]